MQQRMMLEQTLYNLRFDMDCIGEDLPTEIAERGTPGYIAFNVYPKERE